MTFAMLPYTKVDGIRTVKDSQIKELFERTQKDGMDKIVFYEGSIQTPDQFLRMFQSDNCLLWLLFDGSDLVGYAWLNRFENNTARQHFCVFSEHWGKSIDLGKFVLDKIMNMTDEHGNYIWDLLTGYVPEWNQKAINFALKCGGKIYGKIPNAIWNAEKQKSEPAVFVYYTRGEK